MPSRRGRQGRSRRWIPLCATLLLTACASPADQPPLAPPAKQELEKLGPGAGAYPVDVYDPFEGLNRRIYKFNAEFDRKTYLPIVEAYESITPEFAQTAVSNFFNNVANLTTFANAVLQLKLLEAAQTAYRFALNSTIGVLGLFDPSTAIGVPQHDEDFGQTLGTWGVSGGPYLVLPILGPSNVRDTAGLGIDLAAFAIIDPFGLASLEGEPPMLILYGIDMRKRIGFRYYETGSPYEYDLVRLLYTKERELAVTD